MDYNEPMPVNGDPPNRDHAAMLRFASIKDTVKILRPERPVRCQHPEAYARSAAEFRDGFPGTVFYAVKVNPSPYALRKLYDAGIRSFDVASLEEVAIVRGLFPDAELIFMHPVKSREAIRKAYFDYGVRDFSLDTFEELYKILEETKSAVDLGLHVRVAMPQGMAVHELSNKFGADFDLAINLLQNVDHVASRTGLCFHVGHLCLDQAAYRAGIAHAATIIKAAGVKLDVFDVGGGFSRTFPGMEAPPLKAYFDAIADGVKALRLPKSCQIWCEPGLALTTEGESLIVRVELRKGDALYINDGTYGSLYDCGGSNMKKRFAVQMIRPGRKVSKNLRPFQFFGPTCDGTDFMPGPFLLPEDTCEGDWIVLSNVGAYSAAMQTKFNGFACDIQVEIDPAIVAKARSRKPAEKTVDEPARDSVLA
jgi:ornithine decarboxylase